MANQIQIRRDTSTNWAATNPVLANGEMGYDTTLKKIKVGDGSTAWASLSDLQAMGEYRDVVGMTSLGATAIALNTDFTIPQSVAAVALSSANAASAMFYFDPADYAVTGRTTKLRIMAWAQAGGTSITSHTLTLAMYPVSSTAANVITKGTVVTGSSTTSASIATINTRTLLTGTDFTAPAAGYYVLIGTNSATPANSMMYGWKLQVRVV